MLEPQLRASRVLRLRARVRRVPRYVDLTTYAERQVIVAGYDVVPRREPAPASLFSILGRS